MIGNNYKRKHGYYGEYPPSYIRRVKSLFPSHKRVLHLFSGKVQDDTTMDINPELNPSIIGEACMVHKYFDRGDFDLIMADPPYSAKDAEQYGTKSPNKAAVMRSVYRVISPDGVLIWLDTSRPIYKKEQWKLSGVIALDCGTNRRLRGVFIFVPRTPTPEELEFGE